MKKGKLLKIKLNEEMAKKLAYVSEKEGLTLQNQLVAMIRQKISYFEMYEIYNIKTLLM